MPRDVGVEPASQIPPVPSADSRTPNPSERSAKISAPPTTTGAGCTTAGTSHGSWSRRPSATNTSRGRMALPRRQSSTGVVTSRRRRPPDGVSEAHARTSSHRYAAPGTATRPWSASTSAQGSMATASSRLQCPMSSRSATNGDHRASTAATAPARAPAGRTSRATPSPRPRRATASASFSRTHPGTGPDRRATTESCGTERGSPAPSPAIQGRKDCSGVNTRSPISV